MALSKILSKEPFEELPNKFNFTGIEFSISLNFVLT
jgi:hypothetical protein